LSRPLLVLPLVLFLASEVRAQPLFYTVETLDWMAADSQVVVRAAVVDFVQEVDGSQRKWITVVIKVRETFKGRHKPFHTYVAPEWDHHEVPRWKSTERELLVFLADAKPVNLGARWWGEKGALYELTPRNGYGSVIELTAPAKLGRNLAHLGKVYTLDLQDPTDPKTILQYTRDAIAANEKVKPLREHHLVWPRGAATFTRRVPVNVLLERQARRWVVSDDPTLREEGARSLKFFKSDENVAALKKLLTDTSFVSEREQEGARAPEAHRVYRVRAAAFDSLQALGVQVPEPVMREPLRQQK
jgi:hypothetical protein